MTSHEIKTLQVGDEIVHQGDPGVVKEFCARTNHFIITWKRPNCEWDCYYEPEDSHLREAKLVRKAPRQEFETWWRENYKPLKAAVEAAYNAGGGR